MANANWEHAHLYMDDAGTVVARSDLSSQDVNLTAGGGGGAAGAARVLGPFPFAFDDAGLEDGIAFYTPTVGDVLLDAWISVTEAFNGTTPFADVFPIGQPYGVFGWGSGAVDVTHADTAHGSLGGGWTLSRLVDAGQLAIASYALLVDGLGPSLTLPANPSVAGVQVSWLTFRSADPLLIGVSQNGQAGGTAVGGTAGAGAVYLIVATPSLT